MTELDVTFPNNPKYSSIANLMVGTYFSHPDFGDSIFVSFGESISYKNSLRNTLCIYTDSCADDYTDQFVMFNAEEQVIPITKIKMQAFRSHVEEIENE